MRACMRDYNVRACLPTCLRACVDMQLCAWMDVAVVGMGQLGRRALGWYHPQQPPIDWRNYRVNQHALAPCQWHPRHGTARHANGTLGMEH